jgi:FtsP/CotA-like multicopper oxidase with cupredoxin domain
LITVSFTLQVVDYWRPTALPKERKLPVKIAKQQRQAAILANGAAPGTTLEMDEGNEVEVTVVNECLGEGLSIHWHGLPLTGTPWADGTFGVSQSLIKPSNNFTYRFTADRAGTHIYQSQNGGLMGSRELKGAMIVHKLADPYKAKGLYSEELIMQFSDAWKEPEICLNAALQGVQAQNAPHCPAVDKITMNGQYGDGKTDYPYPLVQVDKEKCYRVRFVGLMSEVSNLKITVAGHTMQLISADGTDLEPVDVSSINLYAGERYDAIICADQPAGNFLINATYANGCGHHLTGTENAASCSFYSYLHYKGSVTPHDTKGTGGGKNPVKVTGPALDLGTAAGYNLTNPLNASEEELPTLRADATFTLNLGVLLGANASADEPMTGSKMYLHTANTPWVAPTVPLVSSKGACGADATPMVKVADSADEIEIIVNNLTPDTHVIHLHGLPFQVINYGYPSWCAEDSAAASCAAMTMDAGAKVCTGKVLASDAAYPTMGHSTYWGCTYNSKSDEHLSSALHTPLTKDTIAVHRRSWVVLRLKTTNPGYWTLQASSITDELRGAKTVFEIKGGQEKPVPHDVPVDGHC